MNSPFSRIAEIWETSNDGYKNAQDIQHSHNPCVLCPLTGEVKADNSNYERCGALGQRVREW